MHIHVYTDNIEHCMTHCSITEAFFFNSLILAMSSCLFSIAEKTIAFYEIKITSKI